MTLSIILLEYLQTVQHECLQLRKDFASLKKAKSHAKELLPEEPISLVEKYNDGKQPYAKADLVATRHSRFTLPALPVEGSHCDCSGKCSTKGVPAEIVFINVNLLAVVKRMHARTFHCKMNKVIKRPLACLY